MAVLSKNGDDTTKLMAEGYEAAGILRAALPDGNAEVLGPFAETRPSRLAMAGVRIILRNCPLTLKFMKEKMVGWRANTDPHHL